MDLSSGNNGIILLVSLFLLTFLGMFLTRKRKMWQAPFNDKTPREEKILQRITVFTILLAFAVPASATFASSIWFGLSMVLFIVCGAMEMYMEYKLRVRFSSGTASFIRGKTVLMFLPLRFVMYLLIIFVGFKLKGII